MASGPITSWQIDRETMEIVTDFIFLGSKIIADGTIAYQAPPFMGFSRQEYWSGLPLPSPDSIPRLGKSPGEGIGYPLQYSWASLVTHTVKNQSVCNVGDLHSILGLGRSPGEENGYPLQCSCLVNSMDCIVHGVAKSWT